jgi:hypothetical protein
VQKKVDWKALEIAYPGAAGIDVGAASKGLVLSPDRVPEPVRCVIGFSPFQISPIHSLSERPLRLSPSWSKSNSPPGVAREKTLKLTPPGRIVAPGGELRLVHSTGVTRAAIALPEESGCSRE